jgi:stress response protein YsnF
MAAGQFDDLAGRPVLDAEGSTVGTVIQLYVSDVTGQPDWVVIRTGPEGSYDRFAPLAGAELRGDHLLLGVPARLVSEAPWPGLDNAGRLPAAGAAILSRHYTWPGTQTATAGEDLHADDSMIVSEEQLRVRTERVVSGRARLVKYVVTEEVTLTVQVSHEEVRVELEPVAAPGAGSGPSAYGDQATSSWDPGGGSDERWMILHAERPVIQMESVPVERVRLRVETVTRQQGVTGQIRKEQIGAPETESIPPVV